MLSRLHIENFALIDKLSIQFGEGLNVLTGATGAGKSILIDALGLLLGDRASPDLIRSGEDRAAVEAVFDLPDAAGLLEERGLSADGDEVVIRRELQASGKGRTTVNGALVPVSLLATVVGLAGPVYLGGALAAFCMAVIYDTACGSDDISFPSLAEETPLPSVVAYNGTEGDLNLTLSGDISRSSPVYGVTPTLYNAMCSAVYKNQWKRVLDDACARISIYLRNF